MVESFFYLVYWLKAIAKIYSSSSISFTTVPTAMAIAKSCGSGNILSSS